MFLVIEKKVVNEYPTHIVLCLYFVFLRFVDLIMSVSLDCPFFIAPSVFSSVYLYYYVVIANTKFNCGK